MDKRSSWRWVGLVASVLVGCAGLKLGYDFGLRISGVLMGVVASLGTGLMGALLASALIERIGRWVGVQGHTDGSSELR